MSYQWQKTQELQQEHGGSTDVPEVYDNVLSENACLSAVEDSSNGKYNTFLMFSIDST